MADYGSTDIKCPFYLSKQGDRHRIKCEGPEKRTTTQVTCVGEKIWYIRKFCGGDYWACRVYKMLDEKYPMKESRR